MKTQFRKGPQVYMAEEDVTLPTNNETTESNTEIRETIWAADGTPEIQPAVQDAFMTALSTDKPLEYAFPNGSITIRMNYADTTIGECMICSKEVLLSGWEESLDKTIIFGDRERTVTEVRVIAGFIFVDLS